MMEGGTTVGFIGFAAIGHLSGQKDYAIHSHLSPPSALAIKRLLLGSFQMELGGDQGLASTFDA
jgi:hypothetical protein